MLISTPYHFSHGYLSVALCVCEEEEMHWEGTHIILTMTLLFYWSLIVRKRLESNKLLSIWSMIMTYFEVDVREVKFSLQSIVGLATRDFVARLCCKGYFGHPDFLQTAGFYYPACQWFENFNCKLIRGQKRMHTNAQLISFRMTFQIHGILSDMCFMWIKHYDFLHNNGLVTD